MRAKALFKGSISTVHREYIEACNKELSKAVLGQTLTTGIGSAGSYAAAQAHNLIRQDLAAAGLRRVSTCFNRLAAVWTYYNYGVRVLPPTFEFVKDEGLQKDRAERDAKRYTIGWRPTKAYIEREYEIPREDFDIMEGAVQGIQNRATARHSASCPCGRGGSMVRRDFFQITSLRFSRPKRKNNKQRITVL
ncbi:MAG: DUF935 domain-containing protein [Treponema sp.]|jgi:phage gp29-like protein|nr:DUF935 domain-containing protein [Treponema sp.]